jgi:hypothetical protein
VFDYHVSKPFVLGGRLSVVGTASYCRSTGRSPSVTALLVSHAVFELRDSAAGLLFGSVVASRVSTDEAASKELVYRLLGLSSLVGFPIAFGAVGLILFLPWFVGLAGETESEEASFGELLDASDEPPGPKLFGLGMDMGGVTMFAVGFATDTPNLLVGTASGLLVAVSVYLVGSVFVGRVTADAV